MPAEALRLLELAGELGRKGDYEGAVTVAQDAIKALPEPPEHPEVAARAHHIIAWCSCLKFLRTTNTEFRHAQEAVRLARMAVTAGKVSISFLHHVLADLIEVAARCDQLEEAAGWARELTQPESPFALQGWSNLAWVEYLRMNYGAARLAITESVHLVGDDPIWYPRVLVTQALIDAAIGWPRTGLRRLEKAKAALAPEDTEGLCRVALASARCYAMLQDEERARAALDSFTAMAMMETASQRNPLLVEYLSLYAWLDGRAGNFDAARKSAQEAVQVAWSCGRGDLGRLATRTLQGIEDFRA